MGDGVPTLKAFATCCRSCSICACEGASSQQTGQKEREGNMRQSSPYGILHTQGTTKQQIPLYVELQSAQTLPPLVSRLVSADWRRAVWSRECDHLCLRFPGQASAGILVSSPAQKRPDRRHKCISRTFKVCSRAASSSAMRNPCRRVCFAASSVLLRHVKASRSCP